jgi:hypothetical protein
MDYKNLFYIKEDKLFWLEDDQPAGYLGNDGYIKIHIGNRCYLYAHRVLWEMQVGKIPTDLYLDHINRIRHDNRITNLRLCTHQQNHFNRTKQSNNKSGYKGVSWHKQKSKWVAQIKVDKRNKFLGFFDNAEEAYGVYCDAATSAYGEFARL